MVKAHFFPGAASKKALAQPPRPPPPDGLPPLLSQKDLAQEPRPPPPDGPPPLLDPSTITKKVDLDSPRPQPDFFAAPHAQLDSVDVEEDEPISSLFSH